MSSHKTFNTGIKLLYEGGGNNVVDIIFVHGLTGDREETWKTNGASAPWPETLLPSKVSNARVLTFGYDAYVADWRGMVSKNRIGNHSMNMLTTIATHREDDETNDRPIIFVCHSLGGLVCEDALAMAQQRPEKHLKQILKCTRGIVFLGTPHHGSGLARWAESIAKTIGLIKQTNPEILAVLKSESEILERIQGNFHTMIRSRAQDGLPPIEITCFYEELPLAGVGVVVPSQSAILPGYIPIGIRNNHMDMTKFEHANDPGFVAVAGELRRWIKEWAAAKPAQSPDATSQIPFSSLSLRQAGLNNDPQPGMAGHFFQGMPTAGLPEEITRHLPRSTMGPKERNLLKAAAKGDLETIKKLTQEGANLSAINEEGASALTRAISRRHVKVVKYLLENGASTEIPGFVTEKPLQMAVKTGNVKLVELVLDYGADIDEGHVGTVLHLAVNSGQEDMINVLLDRGADINLFQYPIHSPLICAVQRKDERLIRELLKRGAETTVLGDSLYTALAKALPQSTVDLLRDWKDNKYEELVQVIRDSSSEPGEKDQALLTALKSASINRQPEIHSMFMDLAEKYHLARNKEYVYRG